MSEQEIADRCFVIFRAACEAFERRDFKEHARLADEHKRLAEQHRALVEMSGKPIN